MERKNETRELLIKHFEKYPELQAEDIFKFIFVGKHKICINFAF